MLLLLHRSPCTVDVHFWAPDDKKHTTQKNMEAEKALISFKQLNQQHAWNQVHQAEYTAFNASSRDHKAYQIVKKKASFLRLTHSFVDQ